MLVSEVVVEFRNRPNKFCELVDAMVRLSCPALLGFPDLVEFGQRNEDKRSNIETEVDEGAALCASVPRCCRTAM